MQSACNNSVSNNWEEVDSKEITSLVSETNGRKENVLSTKEVRKLFPAFTLVVPQKIVRSPTEKYYFL